MLTYSIVWLALAATVILIAMSRRTAPIEDQGEIQDSESSRGIAVLAIIYGTVLLAGFVYVTWQHGLGLLVK